MLTTFACLALAGSTLSGANDPSRVAVPISPATAGIGRVVAPLTGVSLRGDSVRIPQPGAKFTVVALTGVSCPLTMRYGPTLAALEDQYAKRGVQFVFVNPAGSETTQEMKAQVARLGLNGSYLNSPNMAANLGAKTTTEAFLLNSNGKLLYRGAVDDQYSIGANLPKPRNQYLVSALESALAGAPVKVAATWAPGCLLADAPPVKEAAPTYHEDIERLVQKNCIECHRTGGPAPFALDTYEAVKSRAPMLKYVVEKGIMPPWFATKPGATSEWKNDRSLADAEKAKLNAWIDGGFLKGDPKKAPKPFEAVPGWTIGKPDVVLQMPDPIQIPATGTMSYQYVKIPTGFTEDKWIQKVEVLPGDTKLVHHILVFIIPPAGRTKIGGPLDTGFGGLSTYFGIYVPGNSTQVFTEGLAKRIPAGSTLQFQIHYTPNGTASTDQSKIGLIFAKAPPKNEVFTSSVAKVTFMIPPGAPNHLVTHRVKVPLDIEVLSYLPHMHVRGKAAKYELIDAKGAKSTLLDIPRYDFNWQLAYLYRKPIKVAAGSELHYSAWYDNSDKNPANPDPKKTVFFGDQTFDEMFLGYFDYIVPGLKFESK
ncbi:MAG: redoxin family protein [Fimbriimonas sp.]